MSKRNYTYAELDTIPAPPKGSPPFRYQWPGCPGLYFQVTPNGARSWVVRGTMPQAHKSRGKSTWRTIATHGLLKLGEVTTKAVKWLGQIKLGVDPAAPVVAPVVVEAPRVMTVGDLWTEYSTNNKTGLARRKPNTIKNQSGYWRRYCEAKLKDIPLDKIHSGIANSLLDNIDMAPTRKGTHEMLSKLFNWGMTYHPDILSRHPLLGREKPKAFERQNRLWDEDMEQFGKAWRDSKSEYKFMLLFLLLTGTRDGVMIRFKPEWRIDEGALELPDGLPGLKDATFCIIPKAARSLLDRVCPCSYSVLNHGLDNICSFGPKDNDINPHDLRRSFSSFGLDIGQNESIIDSLLNHIPPKIRRIYFVKNRKTMEPVAENIANHIIGLMGMTVGDIIEAVTNFKPLHHRGRKVGYKMQPKKSE